VERNDSRVVKPRSGDRLALRSGSHLWVVCLYPLYGDDSIEPFVECQPNDAESACAEAAHQAVALENDRCRSFALWRRLKLRDRFIDSAH
jgi:hypothetical protein